MTLATNATLYVNGNTALGSGTLSINGGVIDSTTAGIALGNVPQAWNADFTFGGTNNLNFGTGAVLLGSSRTIIFERRRLDGGRPDFRRRRGLLAVGYKSLGHRNSRAGRHQHLFRRHEP